MAKNTCLNTKEHWSRYPTSVFVDLHIFSLLLSFGGILYFLHRDIAVSLALLCVTIFTIAYLAYSTKTVRQSTRVDSDQFADRPLHIRVGNAYTPQLRSVFFRPVIMFPSADKIDPGWLAHEIGHIRSRDHFLYIFIKPALVVFFFAFIGWLLYGLLTTDWQWHLIGTEVPVAVFYMIAYMITSFILIACAALTILFFAPREREYLADRFAHDVAGQQFEDALRKQDKWERCFIDKSWLTWLLNLFTHPSAAKRLARLKSRRFPLMELSFFSGLLYSSTYIFSNQFYQLASLEINIETVSVFSPGQEGYAAALLYVFSSVVISVTALVYVSSLAAFTIERNGLHEAIGRGTLFLLGVAVFRLIGAFPRFDVLDPDFFQIWLGQFGELWLSDALLVVFFMALWWLNKLARGKVDGFSFLTNLIASIVAIVGLSIFGT